MEQQIKFDEINEFRLGRSTQFLAAEAHDAEKLDERHSCARRCKWFFSMSRNLAYRYRPKHELRLNCFAVVNANATAMPMNFPFVCRLIFVCVQVLGRCSPIWFAYPNHSHCSYEVYGQYACVQVWWTKTDDEQFEEFDWQWIRGAHCFWHLYFRPKIFGLLLVSWMLRIWPKPNAWNRDEIIIEDSSWILLFIIFIFGSHSEPWPLLNWT